MVKSTQDFLDWLGLKVGDKIKYFIRQKEYIATIKYDHGKEGYYLVDENNYDDYDYALPVILLLDKKYEILPELKHIGDLKCEDFKKDGCVECPLKMFCQIGDFILNKESKLYDCYEYILSCIDGKFWDHDCLDILKAKLDKEVDKE